MDLFKNFKRKSLGENILHCLVSLIFMVVALSYVYILVWAFISGSKTHNEIVMTPFSLPETWNFSNFAEVFTRLEANGVGFFTMLGNSIWFSVGATFLTQFVTCGFAYVCSKYVFPGSKLPYAIILIMITLPLYGNAGAIYKLYHNLGLIDSYAQILVALTGFNVNFLYYTAYFKNLSWTYAEAAMMDGGNAFDIYFRVMFPQAKPIFTALFITGWMAEWNNYSSGLIYHPKLPTLPVGIYQFNTEMIYRARLDILFAACVLVCIPALLVFTIFNKTITTNVSLGGLKG